MCYGASGVRKMVGGESTSKETKTQKKKELALNAIHSKVVKKGKGIRWDGTGIGGRD